MIEQLECNISEKCEILNKDCHILYTTDLNTGEVTVELLYEYEVDHYQVLYGARLK